MGDRPLRVELCREVLSRQGAPGMDGIPLIMQQSVALYLQQTQVANQVASRAAQVKSATEMAALRAKEISRKLSAMGGEKGGKEGEKEVKEGGKGEKKEDTEKLRKK